MAISLGLRQLLEGQSVAASKLPNKLLSMLEKENLLIVSVHGTRRNYKAKDIESLVNFLENHDESYKAINLDSEDRASQARETGNSKLLPIRSCPGFPVNSYEPITCRLNNKKIEVFPYEGSFLFISDWNNFEIPEDVVIIGVENMENFRQVSRQKHLFSSLGRVLFVSRYPQSTDLRRWLLSIKNKYIHFGDFDLAGIHIYETEFYKYLGERASFFIPEDIERRLEKGSINRYDIQLERFGHYVPSDERVMPLFDLIHKYHRGYDQEGYIKQV